MPREEMMWRCLECGGRFESEELATQCEGRHEEKLLKRKIKDLLELIPRDIGNCGLCLADQHRALEKFRGELWQDWGIDAPATHDSEL